MISSRSLRALHVMLRRFFLYSVVEVEPLVVSKQENDLRFLQTPDTQTVKSSLAINSAVPATAHAD